MMEMASEKLIRSQIINCKVRSWGSTENTLHKQSGAKHNRA